MKRMACCNSRYTECHILGSVRRLKSSGCLVTRTLIESVLIGKANDGLERVRPFGESRADCHLVS